MKPVVDRLEQQYAGKVEFRRYNVDKSQEGSRIMQQYASNAVPTFVFLNADGSVSAKKLGTISEKDMRALLDGLK
jgi:thioredoxin-like negative regulator of GroEL